MTMRSVPVTIVVVEKHKLLHIMTMRSVPVTIVVVEKH